MLKEANVGTVASRRTPLAGKGAVNQRGILLYTQRSRKEAHKFKETAQRNKTKGHDKKSRTRNGNFVNKKHFEIFWLVS